MSPTLDLARALIARRSITPADDGCQDLMIERLSRLGFVVTRLPFGEVSNFWARRGNHGPLLVFAGHTDVVPPGPESAWTSPPFEPTERDGMLYGRGAADMKGALAAMVTACEAYLDEHDPQGSIGFLITSDEEGAAVDGTAKVVDWLRAQSVQVDYCIIGEPGSEQQLGDTVKVGRRGSLSARVTFQGIQGHIAYPHLARNPIHGALAPLAELAQRTWDAGNDVFQPTSFQISNIHGGTGAGNVIPGSVTVDFNFRYSTEQTAQGLQASVTQLLDRHGIPYQILWQPSGNPFLSPDGDLFQTVAASITDMTGVPTRASTAGGTSDGRFIGPGLGCQLLELGPINASIHKIDEHVRIADLDTLSMLYQDILARLLGASPRHQDDR